MATYPVTLDTSTTEFYRQIAALVDLPLETVLADALFKLAGELSLEAIHRNQK